MKDPRHDKECIKCNFLKKRNGKVCCHWCCKEDHDHIECTDSSRCHCDCHDGKQSEENYEVKNPPVEWILKNMGNKLKDQIPASMGFALLIFDYGEGGSTFYISSAKREDMIKAMEEFIARNKNA